jgi:hypothetical protein
MGGKSYAFVLDFNLLPRLAPPKKSMEESDFDFPNILVGPPKV